MFVSGWTPWQTVLVVTGWTRIALNTVLFGSISVGLGWINRDISRWCMRVWCDQLCRIATLRVSCVGFEHLHAAPQAVMVSNHHTVMDIAVLGSSLRRDYRWLAKAELFRLPFLGWHLRLAGHVPVHRGAERKKNVGLPKRLAAVDEQGASLLFFPEGTRNLELGAFQLGAFQAAVELNRPIVPLCLSGTNHTTDVVLETERRCLMQALPPMHAPSEGTPRERAEALRDACHAAMAKALCEAADRVETG